MAFSITQDGKELSKDKYTWDEKTRTFSTNESNLVLDFSEYDGVTFNTGSHCVFKSGDNCTFNTGAGCTFDTGYGCTFNTGAGCTFDTGDSCTFNTGAGCTFDTGYGCTFNTGAGCTFDTGDSCTFDTGYGCTFDTGFDCTFDTSSDCTFDTSSYCTFNTGSGCTFNTSYNCVVVRQDVFEVIRLPNNREVQLCSYNTPGYVKDGYYYKDSKKQYPAVLADGILSEIIRHRGNVYKVKNCGSDKVTYLVQDGDIYSHGDTLKEAKESLKYKISNRDTSMYADYTLDTEVTLEQAIKMYRVITGACEGGTRQFVETHEIPSKMTVKELIELTKGQYNNEMLRQFFEVK